MTKIRTIVIGDDEVFQRDKKLFKLHPEHKSELYWCLSKETSQIFGPHYVWGLYNREQVGYLDSSKRIPHFELETIVRIKEYPDAEV